MLLFTSMKEVIMYKKKMSFENTIVAIEISSLKGGWSFCVTEEKNQNKKVIRLLNGYLYAKKYNKYARIIVFFGIVIKYAKFDKVWQQRTKNAIVKNAKLLTETIDTKYFKLKKGKN